MGNNIFRTCRRKNDIVIPQHEVPPEPPMLNVIRTGDTQRRSFTEEDDAIYGDIFLLSMMRSLATRRNLFTETDDEADDDIYDDMSLLPKLVPQSQEGGARTAQPMHAVSARNRMMARVIDPKRIMPSIRAYGQMITTLDDCGMSAQDTVTRRFDLGDCSSTSAPPEGSGDVSTSIPPPPPEVVGIPRIVGKGIPLSWTRPTEDQYLTYANANTRYSPQAVGSQQKQYRMLHAPQQNSTGNVYEVEITCEGDDDLHNRKLKCSKHPGHKEFIPVRLFDKHHLPANYQHEQIEDLIRCLSSLTVRLKVDKISPNRPPPPYPPPTRTDNLNRSSTINGSGHVSDAVKYTAADMNVCQCRECVCSNNPKTRFGKIFIHTAAHVVHDDLEAEHTTCYFFFDNDTDDQNKLTTICGMENVEINHNEDRCWMFCYTHDLSLVDKLHNLAQYYEKLQEKVREKFYVDWYNVEETDHKLTIIVSHPHGYGKYISIGDFQERRVVPEDPDWTQYTYNTATCPGSSGAPVFVLGKIGWFDYHHHSGTDTISGLNQSTYGLF